MIIQIEITTITMLYNKIIRKIFMEIKVQMQNKFLNRNRTIKMIIKSMIHQINMKILKLIKIKIFFHLIIHTNKNIKKIIMIH